jgi:hypothetical protein
MTRWNAIVSTVIVLVLVWSGVWGIRTYADSMKNTAQRVGREMAMADFADWSDRDVPPDDPEAKRRDQKLSEIADLVNALDFQERDGYRRNRTDAAFFNKLSRREKARFIELTVMESFKRFMKSLDGMPPKQRKEFIEQGLREFAQGRSEEERARAKAVSADMLNGISLDAVRAYLDHSSPDAKLKLAPLIEVVNETMQGLRGNEFGAHRRQ